MSWFCCGPRDDRDDEESSPLLPHGPDSLQPAIHQKFHAYQMIRALRHGCLPSTEQLVVILRRLQAADLLADPDPALSEPGLELARRVQQWLEDLTLLLHKNDEDQLQELLANLSRARVSVNAPNLSRQVRSAKKAADAAAG